MSLDDFGTGHSSLAYLQRFPFDSIKIDQSFVRPSNKGKRPVLLRSIIAMAHDLGMTAIAEGVESDAGANRDLPDGLQCRAGLLFGEPMSAEQARALIIPEKSRRALTRSAGLDRRQFACTSRHTCDATAMRTGRRAGTT